MDRIIWYEEPEPKTGALCGPATDVRARHRVRASVRDEGGSGGYRAIDVEGGDWARVYTHFENATERPVKEGWIVVDEGDDRLDVVSVRVVDADAGRRMVEVRAIRRSVYVR